MQVTLVFLIHLVNYKLDSRHVDFLLFQFSMVSIGCIEFTRSKRCSTCWSKCVFPWYKKSCQLKVSVLWFQWQMKWCTFLSCTMNWRNFGYYLHWIGVCKDLVLACERCFWRTEDSISSWPSPIRLLTGWRGWTNTCWRTRKNTIYNCFRPFEAPATTVSCWFLARLSSQLSNSLNSPFYLELSSLPRQTIPFPILPRPLWSKESSHALVISAPHFLTRGREAVKEGMNEQKYRRFRGKRKKFSLFTNRYQASAPCPM